MFRSILAGVLAATCLASFSTSTSAAPAASVEGEYQCQNCNGLLTLKRLNPTELQMWLGVGRGTCRGEALINRSVRYTGGILEAPHKQGQVRCFAHVEFTDKGATITDTCFTSHDEQNSPCTMLGTYTKSKQ